MTKREKRLRDLRRTIASWETRREAAIRTLVRSEVQLPALRKRAERLAQLLHKPATPAGIADNPSPVPATHVGDDRSEPDNTVVTVEHNTSDKPAGGQPDHDDLPTFLVRTKDKDAEAAAKVRAQAEAEKKRKAAVRIEKMKIAQEHKQARLTGATRRLPLSGKAALAAIRAQQD